MHSKELLVVLITMLVYIVLHLRKGVGYCSSFHIIYEIVNIPTCLLHIGPFAFSCLMWEYTCYGPKNCYPDHTHLPLAWKVPCYVCVHLLILGAQLREWLLYFSLPVLKGILSAPQLDHFCYLVAGIHIVLSDADLSCADRCFHQFYSQYTIYGNNCDDREAVYLSVSLSITCTLILHE